MWNKYQVQRKAEKKFGVNGFLVDCQMNHPLFGWNGKYFKMLCGVLHLTFYFLPLGPCHHFHMPLIKELADES